MVWTRLENETSRAYHAFCIYRDMGPERSLEKVRKKLREEGKKVTIALIYKWSKKYNWVERAIAYDDYLDGLKRIEQEKAIKEMAERHAQIAKAMLDKVYERVIKIDPNKLKPSDVAKWVEVAIKIERLARGEPTEINNPQVPKIVEVLLPSEAVNDEQKAD